MRQARGKGKNSEPFSKIKDERIWWIWFGAAGLV